MSLLLRPVIVPFIFISIVIVGLAMYGCDGDDGTRPDPDPEPYEPPARNSWVWQNPNYGAYDLEAVSFLDESRGIAVGEVGAVITTEDGGQTWTLQERPMGGRIEAVAYVAEDMIIAAGEVLIRSRDGGVSWDVIAAYGNSFMVMGFSDGMHGCAYRYHELYITDDGGETWSDVSAKTDLPQGSVRDMDLLPSGVGFMVGGLSNIWKTHDHGLSWTEVSIPLDRYLNAVHLIDDETAIAVGSYETILRTDDGGLSWAEVHRDETRRVSLTDVYMFTALSGWAVGDLIMKTGDGGLTWTNSDVGCPKHVDYTSRTKGFGVSRHGLVYETTEGGHAWEMVDRDNRSKLVDVSFANRDIGIAVSERGAVFRTEDGGDNWSLTTFDGDYFTAVWMADPALAVITSYASARRTADGGQSWQTVVPVDAHRSLNDVCFADPDTGFIAGEESILKTVDGGLTWQPLPYEAEVPETVPQYLVGVSSPDGRHATVIGRQQGLVLRTSDGGQTWHHQSLGQDLYLDDVWFSSREVGYVVADTDIYKTADGGETWWVVHSRSGNGYDSITFYDDQHGVAVGYYASCRFTDDGGMTWYTKDSQTYASILAFAYLDPSFCVGVGPYGVIVKLPD